jgi:hypothetical protein
MLRERTSNSSRWMIIRVIFGDERHWRFSSSIYALNKLGRVERVCKTKLISWNIWEKDAFQICKEYGIIPEFILIKFSTILLYVMSCYGCLVGQGLKLSNEKSIWRRWNMCLNMFLSMLWFLLIYGINHIFK